jgi:hypothetical protein
MGMVKTYEQWLSQANHGLHLMRCARAETMIDFSVKDPLGFTLMVDAMVGLGTTLTPDVKEIWTQMRNDTLQGRKA